VATFVQGVLGFTFFVKLGSHGALFVFLGDSSALNTNFGLGSASSIGFVLVFALGSFGLVSLASADSDVEDASLGVAMTGCAEVSRARTANSSFVVLAGFGPLDVSAALCLPLGVGAAFLVPLDVSFAGSFVLVVFYTGGFSYFARSFASLGAVSLGLDGAGFSGFGNSSALNTNFGLGSASSIGFVLVFALGSFGLVSLATTDPDVEDASLGVAMTGCAEVSRASTANFSFVVLTSFLPLNINTTLLFPSCVRATLFGPPCTALGRAFGAASLASYLAGVFESGQANSCDGGSTDHHGQYSDGNNNFLHNFFSFVSIALPGKVE
jgi:hypothetical protein